MSSREFNRRSTDARMILFDATDGLARRRHRIPAQRVEQPRDPRKGCGCCAASAILSGMRTAFFTLLLAALLGCSSTVEPRTQVYSAPESDAVPFRVFVTANIRREEVAVALEKAGVAVATDLASADGVLRVKIGSGRPSGRCHVRNVVFDLRENGRRLVAMKARGPMEPCSEPTILVEMSEELARTLSVAP
jgi:hypothetical protein